jgi:hypothetical protein
MHCSDARRNPSMYSLAAQPVAPVTGSLPLPQLDVVHIPPVSVRHQDILYHKEEVEVAYRHTYLDFAPQGQPFYDEGVLLVALFYTKILIF